MGATMNWFLDACAIIYLIEAGSEQGKVERATHLRVRYSLRTPDALQAACALMINADKFLTGDKQFLSVQELQVELV
jgi:predicted nucleic acid-binding protein